MAKKDSFNAWFIEANHEADCFKEFDKSCKATNGYFSYILHDKDVTEEGEKKADHYHAVILLNKPMTFEEMQVFFKGAHIEKANDVEGCTAYLLHDTPQARYEKKHLYTSSCVVTNDQKHFERDALQGRKEILSPDQIVTCILDRGYTSLLRFLKDFRASGVNAYRGLIKDCITELVTDGEQRKRLTYFGSLYSHINDILQEERMPIIKLRKIELFMQKFDDGLPMPTADELQEIDEDALPF